LTLKFLLDTNIVSEMVKESPSSLVLERIRLNEKNCAISSVTWHELKFGMCRLPESRKKNKIRKFVNSAVISAFSILPYDKEAADIHADFRGVLKSKGRILPFSDSQIAATALANRLILVTRNVKDFQYVEGLTIENWFE